MGMGGSERDPYFEAITDSHIPDQGQDSSAPPSACVVKGTINEEPVWLVDAPSTPASDTDILQAVNRTLENELTGHGSVTVHGVICLHDINEVNISDTATQNLKIFTKLLGPTRGANVVIVTTLWDMLLSADHGLRVEAALKNIYSLSLPDVIISRVQDSRDDETDDIYRRTIHDLVDKTKSVRVSESSTPQFQLQSIIEEKDEKLKSLGVEFCSLKEKLSNQSLELKTQVDQTRLLKDQLEKAEEKIRQVEAEHSTQMNKLQKQFDTELQNLTTKLQKSEIDRADLARRLNDPTQRSAPPPTTRRLNVALNTLDARGEFPLYSAAAGGGYNETKRLLEQGADASMRTRFRWTALHWAANNGHADVVRLLLEYGADVNAVSDTGKRPLEMAKNGEIRGLLVARGAR
ncbi:hypothetical protein F4825DRAFT_243403 [Nemania diffusa]|nr:hypothetical protein F4825DRAFT_243403 [Nemania diffusa]